MVQVGIGPHLAGAKRVLTRPHLHQPVVDQVHTPRKLGCAAKIDIAAVAGGDHIQAQLQRLGNAAPKTFGPVQRDETRRPDTAPAERAGTRSAR